MYLFKSKVMCMKCLQNMRGKLERNKNVYICSMYSKKSTECIRYVVHESELVKMIEGHLKVSGATTVGNLSDYVKIIEVDPVEKTQKIIYKDGTHSLISQNGELGIKYKL